MSELLDGKCLEHSPRRVAEWSRLPFSFPISQMRKLRHREVRNFPKITELRSGRARTELQSRRWAATVPFLRTSEGGGRR